MARRDSFKEINPDNDGTLDAKELEGRLTESEIKAADPDNDGTLDEKEYLAVVKKKFEAANPDNDGTVDLKSSSLPPARNCSSSSTNSHFAKPSGVSRSP